MFDAFAENERILFLVLSAIRTPRRGKCECDVTVFWRLALARRRFAGRVYWWELRHSVSVAHAGEKVVYGPCVLVGA